MKKIIISLLLLIPFMVKADINKMYIDSEVDIAGNIIVKEIIEVDSTDEFILSIPYKSENTKVYKENDIVKDDSIIYDAENIQINKIGTIDTEYDINDLYKDDFSKNVTEYKDYKTNDTKTNIEITFKETKKNKIYYLEYLVLCTSVKHNDSAELYYSYIRNSNQNIKEAVIITRLPENSSLFEVYAHGNNKINVSKDDKDSIVLTKINNLKRGSSYNIRILYDKDIFKIAINDSKKSNINAVNLIKDIENSKLNKSNFLNVYKYISIPLIIVLIVSFIVIKRKTK